MIQTDKRNQRKQITLTETKGIKYRIQDALIPNYIKPTISQRNYLKSK
jgi:hypothetical protein